MVVIYFLFLLIVNSFSYNLTINENNNIILFKPNKQPFLINDKHYRESINKFFVLNFKPGLYFSSEKPFSEYKGTIFYGKRSLKDTIVNNKWKIIDIINFNLKKKRKINILSSITLNYKHSEIIFKLIHNDLIIDISNKIDKLFSKIFEKGYHTISLQAKSKNAVCICPSFKDGYLNSYQLAVWWINKYDDKKNSSNSTNIPIPNSVSINNYDNVISKINISYNSDSNISKNYSHLNIYNTIQILENIPKSLYNANNFIKKSFKDIFILKSI